MERVTVTSDPSTAASSAAEYLEHEIDQVVTERGMAVLAFSGGSTPMLMFDQLAGCSGIDWTKVLITQVDERIAPNGHKDRNWTHLVEHLIDRIDIPSRNLFPLPVNEDELKLRHNLKILRQELLSATKRRELIFDAVHLGLGADGHTASLVPYDDVLDVSDEDFAITVTYNGRRRVTLTYPVLNRAERLIWLVTGSDKTAALQRMLAHDKDIPAGRIENERSMLFADRAAMATVLD